MRSFALDHLTVADTTPSQLVTVAGYAGFRAVCLFLHSLTLLPHMPPFDLRRDPEECKVTRRRCEELGVSIDLIYPFTISARTQVEDFRPALEIAAWLGAKAVNTLLYDRDPIRQAEVFARFCHVAREYGLGVVVEFYPVSQVQTFAAALALLERIGKPGKVGINVDVLHLLRSGGNIGDVAAAPPESINYAQYCDGPTSMPHGQLELEASSQRLLPGDGVFDLRGFDAALPAHVRASVEIPRDMQIGKAVPASVRAADALAATYRALARSNGT